MMWKMIGIETTAVEYSCQVVQMNIMPYLGFCWFLDRLYGKWCSGAKEAGE